MTARLYAVEITDLGTYRLTVAADTPVEAEAVAKETLWEEATTLPAGMKLGQRETKAGAEELATPPVRQFTVSATYSLDFEMTVPAATREEAEKHAARLYRVNCGLFEFNHCGDRVSRFVAEEVVS